MLALLSTYELGSFLSLWAQKLAVQPLFSLPCTPRESISPSPEMDGLFEELSKLQAPKAISGFPGQRVP